jgi:ribose-phosphate pyrophosphokinase
MASRLPELRFFAGRSNPQLAQKIADANGFEVSKIKYTDFANNEMKVKIEDSVRGDDVYILQTTSADNPHKWMMELFMIAHTAKRASARRITAVIPYIYGSRQDRKTQSREPITIQMMGELLYSVGIRRVITVSLHNAASVAAFGPILVDNITSSRVFYNRLAPLFAEKDFIVMSPDAGGVPRAKAYANRFGVDLGFCYKARPKDNQSRILSFNGDVENKNVLIVDDMIDTGGSLCGIAYAAKERGAKDIYVAATHGILSNNAVYSIQDSPITKVFISDSIHHDELPDKFEVLSLGELLCKTVKAVNADESVGELFEKEDNN